MPAGRPTKYDRRPVIYGLHDGNGNVFYVGKSTRLSRRLSAYRQGRFHGNEGLRGMVQANGLHWMILCDNPEDVDAAEFDEIEAREGLVNLITERDTKLLFAKSDKLWNVSEVQCPTAQYRRHVRNAFGLNCKGMKADLKALHDAERLAAECHFASFMLPHVSGIQKWVDGMAEKAEAGLLP